MLRAYYKLVIIIIIVVVASYVALDTVLGTRAESMESYHGQTRAPFFTNSPCGNISLLPFLFRFFIEIWLLVTFSLVKTKFVKFPTSDLPVM